MGLMWTKDTEEQRSWAWPWTVYRKPLAIVKDESSANSVEDHTILYCMITSRRKTLLTTLQRSLQTSPPPWMSMVHCDPEAVKLLEKLIEGANPPRLTYLWTTGLRRKSLRSRRAS